MVTAGSIGVAVKTLMIALFCLMVVMFAYLFVFGDYTTCLDIHSRWFLQIITDFTIYVVVLGAWYAYKESSWIIALALMVPTYLAGCIISIGYILTQFYKLSPEESSKDPLYFVLARRQKRDGAGYTDTGRHYVVTARIIYSALGCVALGMMIYSVYVDLSPSYIKYFTSCFLTNGTDIYIHAVIFSVWVAYKESSDIGNTSDSALFERKVIDSVELPSVSRAKERVKTVSFDDSPPSVKRLKVDAQGSTIGDLAGFEASVGIHSSSAPDSEVGSFIKCSTLSVTTIATTLPVVIAVSQEKAVDESPLLDQSLVTHSAGTMCSSDTRDLGDVGPDGSDNIYIPQWDVSNDSCLSGPLECRSLINKVAPPCMFAAVRGLSHEQLFSVFNVTTAHQTVLGAEVRRRGEDLLRENVNLSNLYDEQSRLLGSKDEEINKLKARLSLADAEVAEAVKLRNRVFVLESSERVLMEQNSALRRERDSLETQVAELRSLASPPGHVFISRERLSLAFDHLVEEFMKIQVGALAHRMATLESHFEKLSLYVHEAFCPRLLSAVADRRWLLTHGIRLAVVKCLNSSDYVAASGRVISSAIIKGIQDGLVAGLAHSRLGADLSGVPGHYPLAQTDYQSALQNLREFEFPLFAAMLANKDSRIGDIMELLHLEGAEPLSNALERCERDVIKVKKSIAAVEEAIICCVSPFFETALVFTSVDASLVLCSGLDVPEAPTFVSLGPSSPVSSEACSAVSTDAHAARGDSPSGAPTSSSAEEEGVIVST
ncbi:hypothetical protein CTI12_AA456910 [Artemisia annua]|uniref:Uncharacterized protein n=1 Tax=Artemisia annua TaxID=35608 RepID=A0A2U1LT99_ARTAN|nr:hypothetical protein CTI12_AA456910 [Artemisia annua]